MNQTPDQSNPMDKCYDYRIVRPEHLNHYGFLFGGYLLQLIDELAFVVCYRRYLGKNFLTRAMDNVEFHVSAGLGDLLESVAVIERVGHTSVHVRVQVFIDKPEEHQRHLCFDGKVVLVCVDQACTPVAVSSESSGG